VKTMYLFPNFLTDYQEYQKAESLWRERWDELIRHLCESELWASPWIATTFGDGTPMFDGNPVFSAVSTERRQGVRIIQLEPAGNPREISIWVDKFAKGEPQEITELVIACVLSSETLLYAIDAIEQWITRREVHLQRRHDRLEFPHFPSDSQRLYLPGIAG
jgi:hypothetical protein